MSQLVAHRPLHLPRISRLGWLMGLYAENHALLQRLFDPAGLTTGRHVSSVGDGLDVHLDVLARHAYTVELRLSYALVDPVTGQPDPSAHIRLYRDARQAEATHCYVGRRWQDVIGLYPPPGAVMGHRLQMNTFLGKWLTYLGEKGHGTGTLQPAGPRPKLLDALPGRP